MSADRREISAKAEELSLLLTSDVCNEAFAVLISPARRLDAELDWFPEDDESIVSGIREAVIKGEMLDETVLTGLSSLGKLNIRMQDLSAAAQEVAKKGFERLLVDVTYIDSLIRQCSITDIKNGINRHREAAGITPAGTSDVIDAWNDKRLRILSDINAATDQLSDKEYAGFIRRLARRSMTGDGTFEPGSIVCDLIDRYEIRMHPEIDRLTDELVKSANNADRALTSIDFAFYVKAFNRAFTRWKEAVDPVQRVSLTRCTEHDLSRSTALAIRRMPFTALKKHSLYEGYAIAKDMQTTFVCAPSIQEQLAHDFDLICLGVRTVMHMDPEAFARKEEKSRRTDGITTAFIILLILFYVVTVLLAPKTEEKPAAQDTIVTYEMALPEKSDGHGGYAEIVTPITGFVFQDTMDEDRTCRVIIRNNDPEHSYFLRFSDRDYGNSSVIGIHSLEDILAYEIQMMEQNTGQKKPPELEELTEGISDLPADEKILSILVRSGEETELMLPPGDYLLSYDHGAAWYGWLLRFRYQPAYGGVNYPEIIYDTDEPYSFESGADRTIEMYRRTEKGSIVINNNEEASQNADE